jgi:predicted aspartyl protease
MKKIIFAFLLFSMFAMGCSMVRTARILKSGSVQQMDFTTTIPFEMRMGLIIMQLEIAGKTHDFILDTGAPNVVSKELAEKLGLTSQAERKVKDSQNQSGDLGYSKLDTISIGGINFLNTGVIIADINASDELRCLNVDGLLGANLMRKAIWKFDYKAHTITITSSQASLNLEGEVKKIPFTTRLQGTPVIEVLLNSATKQSAIIDLGSNGGFHFKRSSAVDMEKRDSTIAQVDFIGSRASGLYGLGIPDTVIFAKVPKIEMGEILVVGNIVSCDNSGSTVGNEFFENYDLVLNWFTSEALLIKRKEYDNIDLETYGFTLKRDDGKIRVGGIFAGSNAFKEGLKLGDHILQIDDIIFENVDRDDWCDIIYAEILRKNSEEITVKVMRDEKQFELKLKKERVL